MVSAETSRMEAPFSLITTELTLFKQGAEARIYKGTFHGRPCIVKERFSKKYRHPDLDKEITSQRIKSEARSLTRCQSAGISAKFFIYIPTNSISYLLFRCSCSHCLQYKS